MICISNQTTNFSKTVGMRHGMSVFQYSAFGIEIDHEIDLRAELYRHTMSLNLLTLILPEPRRKNDEHGKQLKPADHHKY